MLMLEIYKTTPLHCAAGFGHTDTVNALLAEGAKVDLSDHIGSTALHVAAYNGHADVINLLKEAGADLKIKDIYGRTALNLAVEYGHAAIVEALQSAANKRKGSAEAALQGGPDAKSRRTTDTGFFASAVTKTGGSEERAAAGGRGR